MIALAAHERIIGVFLILSPARPVTMFKNANPQNMTDDRLSVL
jgi:hypothetical protein